MENKELGLKIARILDNKKAINVIVIDTIDKSSFSDYLIIASGGSERQIKTLVSEVSEQLFNLGIHPRNIEGREDSGWILMDYGDIIVNIFSVEQRNRYNIEKIWADCKIVDINV